MRCKFGGTPDCKVHPWHETLRALRQLLLDTELVEELKWGVPCYTLKNKNVLLLSALKNYVVLSFCKGVLLSDTHHILQKPGEHSQSDRLIKFTNREQITILEPLLKAYIQEAIELEKSGCRVPFAKNPEPVPVELEIKLAQDPTFKQAFESLSPGRKRGYILYFSQPKQATTRLSRIEKCRQKILNGEGLHDKYSG
ncbi:MAG: YdeI family protein [Microscillaceae bacterium]